MSFASPTDSGTGEDSNSDTRLASQHHQPAMAGKGIIKRGPKIGHLPLAADECMTFADSGVH